MKKKARRTKTMGNNTGLGIIIFLGIFGMMLMVGATLFLGCFYTIDAGYRGVLLTFGEPSPIVSQPGFHFKIPIAQSVQKLEIRTTKIQVDADSASKDLQDVQTTIALNYHLMPDSVIDLYKGVGTAYENRVINPAIQESVKSITARFTAEELITRRPEVRDGIKEQLSERLGKYYMLVDDFNIVNFQFSEEFDKAIEAKVTAEQLKFKADRDLERIRVEAEQKITQAKAEAEALKLQKQEITPDLVRLREIEVRREAISKWNGVLPKVTGDNVPLIEVSAVLNNDAKVGGE